MEIISIPITQSLWLLAIKRHNDIPTWKPMYKKYSLNKLYPEFQIAHYCKEEKAIVVSSRNRLMP